MDLVDLFIFFDKQLFLFVNHLPHTNFWNNINILLSSGSGIFLFILSAVFMFVVQRINWRLLFRLFFVISIAAFLTQISVVMFLKPVFKRPRPDLEIDSAITIHKEIGFSSWLAKSSSKKSYAFPSGHATMAFASAYIFSSFAGWMSVYVYILASAVAFSRIYLGKHYPLDVFGGMVMGIIIGIISMKIFYLMQKRLPIGANSSSKI